MRTAVGCLTCLAMTSLAFGAAESSAPAAARPSVYHLHGYYRLVDQVPTWQASNDSPWQVVKGEPWIKPRLVKWGYVPITHDSERYYCLIDDRPRTGSHVREQTFICGDPETVEWMFNNDLRPSLLQYGGH